MAPACILVFDSGMGGLTVAAAVRRLMPEARLAYLADTAAFPYGAWDEPHLVERICGVVGRAIAETGPSVVIVACNTASTVALEQLRHRYSVPFVGTVPAIKPAAARTRSGVIGVLATKGTVSREYTRALIDTYAFHCEVVLHGCGGLADLAERKMRGETVVSEAVAAEIHPVFVERGDKRTDVVVLGCTHYPLLLEELHKAAPWPCGFIDPSDAIARRARDMAEPTAAYNAAGGPCTALVTCRSGLKSAGAFREFGFTDTQLLDLPAATDV